MSKVSDSNIALIVDLYFFGIVIQRPQQGAELIFLKVF